MAGSDEVDKASRQGASTRDVAEILDDELREIVHRRREAGQNQETPEEVRKNFVGLALSGGGIRSAALALGVLQSLNARRILPFIDYLSTVSGGGYAGAYLSSAALKAGRTRRTAGPPSESPAENPVTTADSPAGGQAPSDSNGAIADDELFPIARTPTGQPQEKMLRFIHGGNYLRKTWVFFNRYLIGLLLIWTVVISGLVAATSLAAWAFRSLDHTSSRAWIAALGFEGEIKLAFFPSFVLLIVWFLLWALSYLKYGARGTGILARTVFFLLVLATLVAIAALLGNGEYDFPGISQETVTPEKTSVGTVYAILLSAIAASLLPYLRPARLVRSGTAPKNTVERYTFWLATRALVYGVPFILVAFFARENISGWNERRDDRITRAELVYDDYLSLPLWHQVAATRTGQAQPKSGRIANPPWAFGNIWRTHNQGDQKQLREMADLFRALTDEKLKHQFALTDLDNFSVSVARREKLQKALRGDSVGYLDEFSEIKPTGKPLSSKGPPRDPDVFANEADDLEAHLVESAPQEDSHLSFPARWWHLIKYLGEAVVGDTQNMQENPVYRLANEYVCEREIKWEIARALNERLEQPDFYQTLLPRGSFLAAVSDPKSDEALDLKNAFLAVKKYHPGVKFEDWRTGLHEQRIRALEKQIQFTTPPEGEDHPAVKQLTDKGQIPKEQSKLANAIANEQRERSIVATNRSLLAAFYGELIDPKSVVWSSVVLAADQKSRMRWFLISFCIFLIAGLCVDLNATSLHGFYSTQIGKAWIDNVPGMGRRIPLTRMRTTDVGRPYHLVNASVHVIGKSQDLATRRRGGFLFSKLYCGSDRLGYAPTDEYMDGAYALDDAIAVSGAAVSPVQTSNPLVIALLVLFNVRLGQWVANPARPPIAIHWGQFLRENWPITPFRVLLSMCNYAENRPTCFVADGGHYENLGIEPLLVRRCRLILAMDAGCDADYEFSDLSNVIRIARVSHGISFEPVDTADEPIDLASLMPSIPAEGNSDAPDGIPSHLRNVMDRNVGMFNTTPGEGKLRWSSRHFLVLRIKYPKTALQASSDGFLIYMKSTLTGDEPVELRQFKVLESEFPHNPTADQFYDPVRFDAYVELGHHIANQIGPQRDSPGEPLEEQRLSTDDFINTMVGEHESRT